MISFGRILIVDDDRGFLDMYRDILSEEGYEVEAATTRAAALAALDREQERGEWHVVLLDQKLLGPGGPDQGIELAEAVNARAPEAKTIVVTAYATEESIDRAFAAGVYDLLEKQTPRFRYLLRVKVRNALEAIRERTLGQLGPGQADAQITALWAAAKSEPDSHKKGRLLEELMSLLFRSIDGFRDLGTRRRSTNEEFDLTIRNESRDPLWPKESSLILVECKNWSKPVGRGELDQFRAKLDRRNGRAKLGFFIAASGFTSGFGSALQSDRKDEVLVVCLGPKELDSLVAARNRNETLKQMRERALLEGNGNGH